jgi:hypothetical protein
MLPPCPPRTNGGWFWHVPIRQIQSKQEKFFPKTLKLGNGNVIQANEELVLCTVCSAQPSRGPGMGFSVFGSRRLPVFVDADGGLKTVGNVIVFWLNYDKLGGKELWKRG